MFLTYLFLKVLLSHPASLPAERQVASHGHQSGKNTPKTSSFGETASLSRNDLEHLKSVILGSKVKIPSEH